MNTATFSFPVRYGVASCPKYGVITGKSLGHFGKSWCRMLIVLSHSRKFLCYTLPGTFYKEHKSPPLNHNVVTSQSTMCLKPPGWRWGLSPRPPFPARTARGSKHFSVHLHLLVKMCKYSSSTCWYLLLCKLFACVHCIHILLTL